MRDPLWFLTRQWQLGEFQGEDAASPAFVSVTVQSGQLDGWQTGDDPVQRYDSRVPLEVVTEREPITPDLRTAIELGQALERRLTAAGLSAAVTHSGPPIRCPRSRHCLWPKPATPPWYAC